MFLVNYLVMQKLRNIQKQTQSTKKMKKLVSIGKPSSQPSWMEDTHACILATTTTLGTCCYEHYKD
jgi:hypothetical protein